VRLSTRSVLVLRLVFGLYLVVCVLLVYSSALALPLLPFGLKLLSPALGLEMLLLLSGLATIAIARLEPIKIWAVLLPLGFISTLVSGMHVASNTPPPNVCSTLFHNYGFPFPWYRVSSFYQPAGLYCLLPQFVSPLPRLDLISFILDMIFYSGACFAALETFRGTSAFYRKMFIEGSGTPPSLPKPQVGDSEPPKPYRSELIS